MSVDYVNNQNIECRVLK